MIRVEIPTRGPLPKGELWTKSEVSAHHSCRTCINADKAPSNVACVSCTFMLGAMPSLWVRDPAKAMASDPVVAQPAPESRSQAGVPPVVGGLVDEESLVVKAQREAVARQEEQNADDRALNAGILPRAEWLQRSARRDALKRAADGATWEVRNTVTVGDVCDYFGVPRPREPADLEPQAKRIAATLAASFPHGLHVRDESAFARLVLFALVMERAFRNLDEPERK